MHRIDDEQRQVALDLIYDRRRQGYDPLQTFMALFEGKEAAKAASAEDLAALPIDERLQRRIVDGVRDGLEDDLAEAMQARPQPLAIINEVLLAGMKTVGDLFGAGEQLPFVLQSAEVMKAAVAVLEPHMEKADQGARAGWCWLPSRATSTTSARTWSTSSSPTTATRSTTSASAADRDHHREGRGGRGRRHRHVRAGPSRPS